ncbi:MAG: 39S ribosomal protein L33, mitochondrial [Piccolia ochrophora]|nr:MAG: 39S ribosomal protein L33, mitochondrial [Piccolia ochrophora]
MTFFKITLIRSAIGLPAKSTGVLKALGLRKRMRTVYHPVTQDVAGMIMKVKELVAVSEVEQALTKAEMREQRRPDPGYYVETAMPRQAQGTPNASTESAAT